MIGEKRLPTSRRWLNVICILFILPLSGSSRRPEIGGWGNPTAGPAGWWIAVRANSDATRAVFLDPYTTSGTGQYADFYYDRRVMAADFSGGGWIPAVVVGSNAMARKTQLIPVVTHPVISSDGNTIAYLGCTGGCQPFGTGDRYDIYVSSRGSGVWSQPVVLTTGADPLYEIISLSADGNVLAYGTNLFIDGISRIYIVIRTGNTWGTPTVISSSTVNGRSPELSQDGKQVIWISDPPPASGIYDNILMYASQSGSGWSTPQMIYTGVDANHDTYQYRFTADGNSIFYWNVSLNGNLCEGQDLYILRRSGSNWTAPQKLTATPVVPLACNAEAPAGMDYNGTRAVYPRTVLNGSTVSGSFLEMVEYQNGIWGAPVAITAPSFPYYNYPNLSFDGEHLVSNGPNPAGGPVLIHMDSDPRMNHILFLPLIAR